MVSFENVTNLSTTYLNKTGTKVVKRWVDGNTGSASYRRLEKIITPGENSRLAQLDIAQVVLTKEFPPADGSHYYKKPLMSVFFKSGNPNDKYLHGETVIAGSTNAKKFFEQLKTLKESGVKITAELIRPLRKMRHLIR